MQNSSNIDLKFFMEENNEEAFYATLDDQDSINSENLSNFPKPPCKNDEVRFEALKGHSLKFLIHRMSCRCYRQRQAALTTQTCPIRKSNTKASRISGPSKGLSSAEVVIPEHPSLRWTTATSSQTGCRLSAKTTSPVKTATSTRNTFRVSNKKTKSYLSEFEKRKSKFQIIL